VLKAARVFFTYNESLHYGYLLVSYDSWPAQIWPDTADIVHRLSTAQSSAVSLRSARQGWKTEFSNEQYFLIHPSILLSQSVRYVRLGCRTPFEVMRIVFHVVPLERLARRNCLGQAWKTPCDFAACVMLPIGWP